MVKAWNEILSIFYKHLYVVYIIKYMNSTITKFPAQFSYLAVLKTYIQIGSFQSIFKSNL